MPVAGVAFWAHLVKGTRAMSCTDELGNLCTHKVSLHFRSIAMPAVSEFTALQNAQRVYGPHGICVEYASGQCLQLSAEDTLTLDVVDGKCKWDSVSDEQRLLHGLGGGPVGFTGIRVYYVNRIRKPDGKTLNGCAGHAPLRAAVAVAARGSQWTLAHELGHVLLGSAFRPVHATSTDNVMYSPTTAISAAPPSLTWEQLIQIRNSPYCVAC